MFLTPTKKCVGKSGRGPCGHSAATKERCFPAAKAPQSRRGRMRDMRGESMRPCVQILQQLSRAKPFHSRRRKKTLRKGKRRLEAGVQAGADPAPWSRKRKPAPAGRPATGTKLEWRDIASAMQFLALHCTHHCSAAPVTLLTIRRPDGAFACPLPFLHMALERPMGHHHQRRTMQYR